MNRSTWLTLIVLALLCTAVLYRTEFIGDTNNEINEPDCSSIENRWIVRRDEPAIYLMHDSAIDAIESGEIEAAICTLKIAADRSRELQNDLMTYKLAIQLADIYEERDMAEAAISTLEAAVNNTAQVSEAQTIRRIELLLKLISISEAANKQRVLQTYLEKAIVESSTLEYGNLTKDRVLLTAIENFKSIGAYEQAASYAKELVKLRESWNEQLPGGGDPEHVKAAEDLYEQMEARRIEATTKRR